MTARPVGHYLICFTQQEKKDAALVGSAPPVPSVCANEPEEDITALVEAARIRGRDEGFAEGLAEGEARLHAERLSFQTSLVAERAKWTEDSEALCAKIITAFEAIEGKIAGCVEHIFRPFLTQMLRRKAIEDLTATVRNVLCGEGHELIEIMGPPDLLDALRSNLTMFSQTVNYVENGAIDVTIVANQTLIESQLALWFSRLGVLPE
jgi:hypothetical protein